MEGVLHNLVYVVAAIPVLVVARRYRRLPRVIPISVRPNGVPFAYGPRWLVIAPALVVAVVLPLCALSLRSPAQFRTVAGAELVNVLLIELALFVALMLGLEAEVAVGTLRRVPAFVQWVASAVLAATVVTTLIAA